MYNNSAITLVGKCKVQLQNITTKKKYKVQFPIINDQDATSNLLGCSTVQSLGLIHTTATDQPIHHNANISQVISDSSHNKAGMTMEDIKTSYSDVFEGLGLLGPELHLEVDETAKPVQMPPHKVPESLKEPLKAHLDETS